MQRRGQRLAIRTRGRPPTANTFSAPVPAPQNGQRTPGAGCSGYCKQGSPVQREPLARSRAGRPFPGAQTAAKAARTCPPSPTAKQAASMRIICRRQGGHVRWGSLCMQSSRQANPPAPAGGGRVQQGFHFHAVKHTGQPACSRKGRPRAPAIPFARSQAGRPTHLLPQGEAACTGGPLCAQPSGQANPPAPAGGGRVHRRSPLRAAERAGQPACSRGGGRVQQGLPFHAVKHTGQSTCSRKGRSGAPAVPFARNQAYRPIHLLPQGEAACTGGPLCAQSSIQANPPAPARGGQVYRRLPFHAVKHTGQSTCSRKGRSGAPVIPFPRSQAYRPIHLLPQGTVRCTGGSLCAQSSWQGSYVWRAPLSAL